MLLLMISVDLNMPLTHDSFVVECRNQPIKIQLQVLSFIEIIWEVAKKICLKLFEEN